MLKKIFQIVLSLLILSQAVFGVVGPKAIASGANLIANQSVEQLSPDGKTPSSWVGSSWGNNKPTFTYKNNGQNGSHSLYVSISNYVDGDAKWYSSPVSVSPNTKYFYSDYHKANISSDVVVEQTDTAGNVSYQWLGTMPASSSWKKAGFDFVTPAGTAKVGVLHLISGNGWLQTDNFTLATASVARVNQGVANNSFEQSDDNDAKLPLGWQEGNWGNLKASYSRPTTGGYKSNSYGKVVVSNYVDGDAKWYSAPTAVSPGTKYYIGDFYKASVPTDLVVQVDHSDGSTTYDWLLSAPASSSWKQAGNYYTPTGDVKSITLLHVLASNGNLSTDDYSVAPASVATLSNGVYNSGLEQVSDTNSAQPLAWNQGSWGTNKTTFSYLNTGHNSAHSAKVQMTSYTDGDAKWYSDDTAVTAGSVYKLDDWYQSNVETHMVVQTTSNDGSIGYLYLKNAPASSTWANYSDTFTVPAGVKSVAILHLISSVGWLITDDYSLQTTTLVGFNRAIVSVNFDDGWSSIYQNGLPVLDKYGILSTQYIVTGLVGTPDYMSLDQLKSMRDDGQELASHTVTHSDLTTLSPLQLQDELANSKSWLLNNLGVTSASIATPYGSYNSTVLTAIKQYYPAHRGVEMGYNAKNNIDLYDLKVQDITVTTTPAQVQDWVNQAKATNTWLILVYHSVDNTGSAYSISPAQLDAQMAIIKNSGVAVETMAQALNEIRSQL